MSAQDETDPRAADAHAVDPHEARIAELRARRKARMRVLARRSLVGTLALGLLGLGLVLWLLQTVAGRDALLGRIVAALPDGTTLTWGRAEGRVGGALVLHDVRLYILGCPDAADGTPVAWPGCATPLRTTLTATRLSLHARSVSGSGLRLRTLGIADAVLVLPEDDSPPELPRWPESLPALALPLGIEVDALAVDRLRVVRENRAAPHAPQALLRIERLRGAVALGPGALRLQGLDAETDRGRFRAEGLYLPAQRYRTDLTVRAVLPAPAGRTPARLGLVARGDLDALQLALVGLDPAALRVQLRLEGAAAPQWRATADSPGLRLAALTGAEDDSGGDDRAVPPLRLSLLAEGRGGDARLRGWLAQGERSLRVLPSTLSLHGQVLNLAPLRVQVLDGALALRGRLDLRDPAAAQFRGALAARGLRWGGSDALPVNKRDDAVRMDADFRIDGGAARWQAVGDATLRRLRERADVTLTVTGDARSARIAALRATTPGGRLDASGTVGWSPGWAWDVQTRLAGFDPGYFLPEWRGALDGQLRSQGALAADGAVQATLALNGLRGRLRGREVGGSADLRLALPAGDTAWFMRLRGDGSVDLRLGASRVAARGRIADTLDIDARLDPLQLDDALPDARGRLRGSLRLRGPRRAPDLDADLAGDGLAYAGLRAGRVRVQGRLPWAAVAGGGAGGRLRVEADDVDAGRRLDRLRVDAVGAVEALRLDAEADGADGALAVSGRLERRRGTGAGRWQGRIEQLRLDPAQAGVPALRLSAPTVFTQSDDGRRLRLDRSCFDAEGRQIGSLCASADWPGRAEVQARGLPLALLAPLLPARDYGAWRLDGRIDADISVQPRGASWAGTARLRTEDAGFGLDSGRADGRGGRSLLRALVLQVDAGFDPNRVQARAEGQWQPDGRIRAEINAGWDAAAPLSGRIDADTTSLTWLELFSPDLVAPEGRLTAALRLGGSLGAPALGGEARIDDLRAELPALGLQLREGALRLDAQADGSARLIGSVRSGEGRLRVDGSLDWIGGAEAPLRLRVQGENVLISDTRELRASIDPDLEVRYAPNEPLSVVGSVGIRSAQMNLEDLSTGVSASPDVVVVDPANPERGADTPLSLDLRLRMGEDVRLRGFGLDGSLGGEVRMRARPGREAVADGRLDVAGTYSAYGQKLRITRGRLIWSNRAFADPVLDIRAEREVGAVTAGIDVTGRASAPEAEVWSDPASSQSEALSYLALGRPLSAISADETRDLSAASAALSAGGNLLGGQLAARIGLDDVGVSESRALGDTVVGFGKYLSPRLYVGYGVSLLGTGQVVTLRYLLRKGFDIEIESSTVENRASLNWRREK